MDRVPSFFMLVPGPWQQASELVGFLTARGVHAQLSDSNPVPQASVGVSVLALEDMASLFDRSRAGLLDSTLLSRIAQCSHAAVIEVGYRLNEAMPEVAQLGAALRDAGGVAVRMEASGGASAWDNWLECLESGEPAGAYVSAVLIARDDTAVFTCGMHQFDLADVEIALDDAQEAIEWLDAFCVYQIAVVPALTSGHTFRPHAEAARRVVERWPDQRHERADGRYNPYGVWRLLEPDQARVKAGAVVPTILPSLVSQLLAAERAAGRALTQQEVENLASNSTAMAMDPRHVLDLNRSRGYADIEPELAWEQWQIARRGHD